MSIKTEMLPVVSNDIISILCHPERSEGSLLSVDYEILHFVQNDKRGNNVKHL